MARARLSLPDASALRACIDEQGLIEVRVTANASTDEVLLSGGDGDHAVAIRTTATPEHGKANEAVLRLLAKALGLPVSALGVARGATSRIKLVRVAGRR